MNFSNQLTKFRASLDLRETRISYVLKSIGWTLAFIAIYFALIYSVVFAMNFFDTTTMATISQPLSAIFALPMMAIMFLIYFTLFMRRMNDILASKSKNEKFILGLTIFIVQTIIPLLSFVFMFLLALIKTDFSSTAFYQNNLEHVFTKYTNWVTQLVSKKQ